MEPKLQTLQLCVLYEICRPLTDAHHSNVCFEPWTFIFTHFGKNAAKTKRAQKSASQNFLITDSLYILKSLLWVPVLGNEPPYHVHMHIIASKIMYCVGERVIEMG